MVKHNRLVVNPSKSTTMLIGTRPKTKNINLAIYIDNIKITEETSIKLLGVEVDANITWNTHISTLAKKISSKIGLVKRLQQFLPSNTVLSLYPPFIQSHIDYGLTLWGNSSLKNLKLFKGCRIEQPESSVKTTIIMFLVKVL